MAKILIVEDDEVLVKMYTRKLEHDGYEVAVAYSGGEGIIAATREKPDLILLDIMMPTVDGFEVIKNLKAVPETKDIPIIIFTNLGTSEIFINEAKRLGVKDYLIKYKTSASEVVNRIKKELGQK